MFVISCRVHNCVTDQSVFLFCFSPIFQDRDAPEVQARLGTIDRRYKELQELAKLRKQRLMDALSLYKLFNEADMVEAWIDEKVCEPSNQIHMWKRL